MSHLKTLECYDIPLQIWFTELRGTQSLPTPKEVEEALEIVEDINHFKTDFKYIKQDAH